MRPFKAWIVIILLLSAIVLSFALPKAKYIGTNFISRLEMPYTMTDWHGEDVSAKLNINFDDDRYNFLGDALAYQYVRKDGKNLILIIMDAGNFHYPNVCFISSGFMVKELNDTEFNVLERTFKTHTIYTERGKESSLVLYWIIIDKKMVPNWVQQKVKQLYFSMSNKKRVGLMVRLDIPAREDKIEDALTLAKQFISDLSQTLPPEHADYIFGKAPL